MRASLLYLTLFVALFVVAAGCTGLPDAQTTPLRLTPLADSDFQWTGVASSQDGRLFANYPRWQDHGLWSVVEITDGGQQQPYPDERWNNWAPGMNPANRFVCVQSVFADGQGHLWVLDPANPRFEGVVEDGPKLLRIDLASNEVARVYPIKPPAIQNNSYLNDVRIDHEHRMAYMTDSGAGALVVLDLQTGEARRLLVNHPSTQSQGASVVIQGVEWRRPDGSRPHVHADGIALDEKNDVLYYQALTAETLYSVPTAALRDAELSARELAAQVRAVGNSGVNDGIMMGDDGWIYLTSLNHSAIRRISPEGEVEVVVQDPRISWPDTLAWDPEGNLLFTTSQIHLAPDPPTDYMIYRVPMENDVEWQK